MFWHRFLFLVLFALTFCVAEQGFSQTANIIGKVFDKETQKPISGVRITILNTNRGTYSSSSGFFRLTNVSVGSKILFRSIGFDSYTYTFDGTVQDTLKIYLNPLPVQIGEVESIGEIEVNEIIKRAVEKKKENLDRLKTLQAKVYSKIFLTLGGGILDAPEKNALRIQIEKKSEAEKKQDSLLKEFFKNVIAETFSNVFIDYTKDIKYSEITERRQTANFPKEANILVFNEFLSFYDEKVKVLSTEFVTPLAKNCFDYYRYELLGRENFGELYVYKIRVTPKTEVYPAFEGVIKILEKSYNLLELELTPSRFSFIDMFDSLKYTQKFTALNENIWQPSYLELTGKIKVEILKGFLDLALNFRAVSIVTDAIINQPLPDSIVAKSEKQKIAVNPQADSTKEEFWSQNNLVETSDYEKSIYKKIDSISKTVDTLQKKAEKSFTWGIDPAIDRIGTGFNRVTGYSLGISPYVKYKSFSLVFSPSYSFGQKKFYHSIDFKYSPKPQSKITFSIFSDVTPSTMDDKMPIFLNTLFAYLFHWDYYDYYHRKGWRLEYQLSENRIFDFIDFKIAYEHSTQSSLKQISTGSLFSNSAWRENPKITEGTFDILEMDLTFGNLQTGLIPSANEDKIGYRFSFRVDAGMRDKTQNFGAFYPALLIKLPTVYTGYDPMSLSFLFEGGYATAETPIQYSFRMPNFYGLGNFYTAPTGVFGGNKFFAIHFQYNFSDLFWRAIGLPLWNNRGVEILISGAMGKYFNQATLPTVYKPTNNLYTEFGLGLGRIPLLITNLAYWGFEVRYNTSKHLFGRWGYSLNLSAPF